MKKANLTLALTAALFIGASAMAYPTQEDTRTAVTALGVNQSNLVYVQAEQTGAYYFDDKKAADEFLNELCRKGIHKPFEDFIAQLKSNPASSVSANFPKAGGFELPYVKAYKGDGKDGFIVSVKQDTGAGFFPVYQTPLGFYVILGDRSFRNPAETLDVFQPTGGWKVSIGGKVEETETSIKDVSLREGEEERHNQLAPKKATFLPIYSTLGGISENAGKFASKGWGPYIMLASVESGYSYAQLEAAVDVMNNVSAYHRELANFLNGDFENLTAEVKKKRALELLIAFSEKEDELGKNYVDMSPEARLVLQTLSETGTCTFDEKYTKKRFSGSDGVQKYFPAFAFAGDHVHTSTEYGSFKVVSFNDYVDAVKGNTSTFKDAVQALGDDIATLVEMIGDEKKSEDLSSKWKLFAGGKLPVEKFGDVFSSLKSVWQTANKDKKPGVSEAAMNLLKRFREAEKAFEYFVSEQYAIRDFEGVFKVKIAEITDGQKKSAL